MSDRGRLEGRRAVVTGGTRGIGQATASELLSLGAEVLVVARRAEGVERALAGWRAEHGGRARGVAADVTAADGRAAIVQEVQAAWGGLDILVNNAGTNIRKRLEAYEEPEIGMLLAANLESSLELCRLLYPLLRREGVGGRDGGAGDGDGRDGGAGGDGAGRGGDDSGADRQGHAPAPPSTASIVNVASIAALTALGTGAVYSAAKAGLVHLSRYLAVEWGGQGIRVNCVAPWYIRTPLVAPVLDDPERLARVLSKTPLGRVGEPEEVASVIAFLCSDGASYLSGVVIPVDGGMLSDQRVI